MQVNSLPSSGNAYGLGDVRLKEIKDAVQALGVPSDHLVVLNNTHLQDGKQSDWDIDTISTVVNDFTKRHAIDTVRLVVVVVCVCAAWHVVAEFMLPTTTDCDI